MVDWGTGCDVAACYGDRCDYDGTYTIGTHCESAAGQPVCCTYVEVLLEIP